MNPSDPIPLYFGAPGNELFGWMHGAPEGSRSGFALIICNPFGFEEICAHRSLRHLASATAAIGIPTLRFDYAGSGNSRGDEFEPDRLEAWLRSIHAAIDQVKAASQLERVCLVGVRLGATLATLAATDRDDVIGLVAIAPVVKGHDYVRELRILGQATATKSSMALAGDELLESAGFVMTRHTVQSLQAVDLRTLLKLPARQVVIVERDDLPSRTDWPQSLTQLGATVQVENWPGFGAVMTNPQDAIVPEAMIEGIVSRLAHWQPDARRAARSPALDSTASIRLETVQAGRTVAFGEKIVRIDTGTSALFGIVTGPIGTGDRNEPVRGPVVVMLSSGSVHHIGPNRLWVSLARRWAARGITVLRLDLSGIGDSDPRRGRPENIVYSTEASGDIAAALAWARAREETSSCHLLGLCSGAFHALKAAVAGQPMDSTLIINPLTYSWKDSGRVGDGLNDYEVLELSARYRRQVLSVDRWLALLQGRLDLAMTSRVIWRQLLGNAAHSLSSIRRLLGSSKGQELANDLAAAERHQIQLKFVFADTDPGFELMRRQAGRALDGLTHRGLSIDFVQAANHTFTQLDSRERLNTLLDSLLPSVGGNLHAKLEDADRRATRASSLTSVQTFS